MVAIPLIYSVYVGVAEAARDRAVQLAMKHHKDEHLSYKMGGLNNELMAAKLALQHMISTVTISQPDVETINHDRTNPWR